MIQLKLSLIPWASSTVAVNKKEVGVSGSIGFLFLLYMAPDPPWAPTEGLWRFQTHPETNQEADLAGSPVRAEVFYCLHEVWALYPQIYSSAESRGLTVNCALITVLQLQFPDADKNSLKSTQISPALFLCSLDRDLNWRLNSTPVHRLGLLRTLLLLLQVLNLSCRKAEETPRWAQNSQTLNNF